MKAKEYFSLDKILSCDVHYIIFLERRSGVKLHAIKDLQRRINMDTKELEQIIRTDQNKRSY